MSTLPEVGLGEEGDVVVEADEVGGAPKHLVRGRSR